jgi:RNA polymerase sigma factor (sigma-70 family)
MTQPLESLIRHLQRVAGPPGDGLSQDTQLLERWVRHRDEVAFELLLRRHGPMVLAACRRLLGDAHAAEDAFQATWLIFLRHADHVRQRQALAAWLHRVACRVALRARTTAARRQSRERPGVEALAAATPRDTAEGDLRAILDQEIDRLPGHYRQALVLCVLQGKTYAEAARELGRPQGTVASWAARARARLRARLVRRGVAPTAGGTLLAAGGAVSASLPEPLVTCTVQAATATAAGQAAVVSPKAAALAQEVGMLMFRTKSPVVVTILCFVILAAAGVAALALPPPADLPPTGGPRTVMPAPPADPGAPREAAVLERTLKLDGPVRAVAFAPGGQMLACGCLGGVDNMTLFDAQAGRPNWSLTAGEVRALAFSPDGKLLAVSHGGTSVILRDARTGEQRHTLDGHSSFVSSVAVSPDGRTLATGSARVAGGKIVGEVKLWEVRTRVLQRTLDWEGTQVWSVAFAPGGDTVAAGGGGDAGEVVRLWDPRTGAVQKTLRGGGGDWSAALPADDQLTRAGTSRGLVEVYCLAFAPDGKTLAAGGNNAALVVMEAASLRLTKALMGPRDGHRSTIGSVAFSPDGKSLVSGSGDKTAKLWDARSGKLLQSMGGHEGTVNAVALSADGGMLATAGEEKTVRLWRVNKGRAR